MKHVIVSLILLLAGTLTALAQGATISLGDIKRVEIDGSSVYPKVTMAEILAQGKLVSDTEGFTVVSFEVSIKPAALDYQVGPFKARGAEFTPQMRQALTDCPKGGGKVYIDNIRVQGGPDNVIRDYSAIELHYTN